ncbi:hypothetical protein [Aquabacterium sp.]|uniref:hypothetical protein n=1 Tax=Aquabacterium sp. TaxID=1872578 RepID=UPI0025BEB2CC|nr:hypothetical protein [Aquabacterium sp.]
MHPMIKLQKAGEPLPNQNIKVEYHLKSKTGRPVMTFDSQIRADCEAAKRDLDLYRVTTITEKL